MKTTACIAERMGQGGYTLLGTCSRKFLSLWTTLLKHVFDHFSCHAVCCACGISTFGANVLTSLFTASVHPGMCVRFPKFICRDCRDYPHRGYRDSATPLGTNHFRLTDFCHAEIKNTSPRKGGGQISSVSVVLSEFFQCHTHKHTHTHLHINAHT